MEVWWGCGGVEAGILTCRRRGIEADYLNHDDYPNDDDYLIMITL